MPENPFQFEISLSVLNHLGRNLYRNFITVLGEAISNSWDANANNVWIRIDREEGWFQIVDDGDGMDAEAFQNRFLKVGYSKRKDFGPESRKGRPFIGAKGIGKLAMLSCAKRVTVLSKVEDGAVVGGVIDNSGLDEAIKKDLMPDQYQLEEADMSILQGLDHPFRKGTVLHFEGLNEGLRSSVDHLRKLLALSFQFSLLDENFSIYVNGEKIGVEDLQAIADRVEFVWTINRFEDELTNSFRHLKSEPKAVDSALHISGFLATVAKPRDLKVAGTDERASVDLFVNGRLRERNILKHIPTQRILESYIFGQIHFDEMDNEESDAFTSSREGIVENDRNFQSLLDYLKRDLIPVILDEWDLLRLGRGEEGDPENPRKSPKQRSARALYKAARSDYQDGTSSEEEKTVRKWLQELEEDAEFNIGAYADCFTSENLVRRYISENKIKLLKGYAKEVEKWRDGERVAKGKANINFNIREANDDLAYLDMSWLSASAEGNWSKDINESSLNRDALSYTPIRNAVGHTGRLTILAKAHLSMTYENVKARIRDLLSLRNGNP